MPANESSPGTRTPTSGQRRLMIGANVLVQIIAMLAVVIMVNWLVSRHYTRFDWTKSAYYKLSDKTRQVLTHLKEPVQVIVYLPPQAASDSGEKTLQDVRNLLEDFATVGKDKLRVEYVDPDRQLARARQLAEQYKFDAPDVIIFVSGSRHKFITIRDIVEMSEGAFGEPPHVKAFKGEGVFLSAIQTVTEERPPSIYFLTGHGEHDPESFDQRTGYSTLATYIKRDNIDIQRWNLQEQQALPTNAAAIVIAGPHKKFSAPEIAALDQYLKRQGRLFLMLDPRTETGLETFLQHWGVQVDDDLVMRKAGSLLGTELLDVNAVGVDYAPHPVTAKLRDTNTEFPYARSIRRTTTPEGSPADRPRVTELVKTAPSYWGETDPSSENSTFDPATDIAGPLSLAAAVESGQPRGVDVDIGVTRMIVIGTSSFTDNSSLTGGNLDFFMNALNWLLQREQLIAVSPKMPEEFRLDMSPNQQRAVYALVIAGMPLAVAIIGIAVWLRRRK